MSVYIIAEAGVNHNGNFDLACKLVDAAKEAGADCVKFQTFVAEKLVSKGAKKADYQKKNTNDENSQCEMLKKLELSFEEFEKLSEYCSSVGIDFISTPFDFESIDFLRKLSMPFWKIPSGEITNLPYLLRIANTGMPVIMSTGMCEMQEIEEAVNVLMDNGTRQITLLHCNTEYPTPFRDVNLRVLGNMAKCFNLKVGYSDHTKGIEVPIAAVALGAEVIEKHFTLDKAMEGPDHQASLDPNELKQMVLSIRNIEKALGTRDKKVTESERKNIDIARKSIVAKRRIFKGEILSDDNITVKRPGDGISPMRWFDVIGRAAKREFEEDEKIEI